MRLGSRKSRFTLVSPVRSFRGTTKCIALVRHSSRVLVRSTENRSNQVMTSEPGPGPKVEIAHVLDIDVVGYSTLLITEQSRIIAELTQIVRGTARFRHAEREGKLVRVPTGDGMLLVFFGDPEAPIECAMEIS